MNNFSKTSVKALAVLAVTCIPLFAYQAYKDKHVSNMDTKTASLTSDKVTRLDIPEIRPEQFSKIPPDIPEFAAAYPANAQSWTDLTDIKNPRFESTAIQYRDDVYVFNGFGAGINIEPAVEIFDAGTQKWSVIGNTSVAKGNAVTHNGVVRHGNEVWIIGGRIGSHPGAMSSKVWIFNLNTHRWSQGPKLPRPVAAGGAALVNNRIHWFGGLDVNASCDVANHYVYNLDNPSAGWKDLSGIAPMPIPRNHFATVVNAGLIYAIGGQFTHDGCGAGTPDTDLVHVFNPNTNTWTQIASLPAIQSHIEPSTFEHKGAIYVVGGATKGNKVYRYDPSNDIWDTVAVLPQALLAPIARVIDNKLVVSSGGGQSFIPVKKTYATDMAPLLLPGANNIDHAINAGDSSEPASVSDGDAASVTLEAEHHDTLSATNSHQWVSMNSAGASNNAAMTTADKNKLTNGTSGPSMAYFAYFDRPGTWYLWVRGWGDTANGEGANDSLHAGLNGSLSATADKIDSFPPGWNWTNSTRDGVRASLTIPSAGIHAVNLWMREDGLAVDKILLTTDKNHQPEGIGDVTSSDDETLSVNEVSTDTDTLTEIEITSNTDVVTNEPTTDITPDDTTANNATQDATTNIAENNTTENTVDTDGNENSAAISSNGIVAVEVESFDTTTSASNKKWIPSTRSGASENASMVTTDTGLLKKSEKGSPVMNYQVYFDEAGTYKVWLRGWGDTVGNEGKSDSAHVGINGNLSSAAAIQNFPSGWHWSNVKKSGGAATLFVPSKGFHTINIWMREDGLILDKLVLAKNTNYTPSGLGAAGTSVTSGTTEIVESTISETVTSTIDTTSTDATIEGISVEVENYASKSANGAHRWLESNKSGASGVAMEATPNTNKISTKMKGSATMNFPLQFTEAGTYAVWLRGWGDSDGQGKNDSVHVGINGNQNTAQVLENFPNGWSWSNQKRGGGKVTVKVASAGVHTINVSMREDGIILDKLILTKDTTIVPTGFGATSTIEVSALATSEPASSEAEQANAAVYENFTAIRIEAEDFTSKNERWVLTSPGNTPNFQDDPDPPHNGSASGKANLELLPDTRVTHDDPTSGGPDGSLWGAPGPGPSIDYLVNFPEPGRYLVYVKTYSTGSEDNGIHVGINGTKPASGKRMQTCKKRKWVWTSSQRTNEEHCGVPKQIWLDVPTAGENKITFYAREDGFELDQILFLKETHEGNLDCFPTSTDEIRCNKAGSGSKVSETDIPLSSTIGSSSPIGSLDTSPNTDSASNTNFGNQWLKRSTADGSVVQKRHEAGGVTLNGKLYVLGGRGNRKVSVYDPAVNKWSQKAAAPIVLNHFQPVAYNNKIWVIGAFTGSYPNETSVADIYTYSPGNNKWAKEGKIPQNRRRGSTGAVLHGGYIYIVGGNTNGHKPGAKPWLDRFNPTTGAWQTLSDAPNARDHVTVSTSNNKLVVAAGRQSAYPDVFSKTVATTNIYNFGSQRWSTAKSIPTQRAGAMTVAAGDEVVVIGGEVGNSVNAKTTVESYNVVSNTWRQLAPLKIGRHSGAAAVLNNEIHVISGSEKKGGSPESAAHEVIQF